MDSLTLRLTGMAHGGAAIGKDGRGRTIFVPFAIAGETVRVEIVEDRGRFAQARLLEVMEPSPERVEPRCPHYGSCGHSHYQHIAYPAQLRYKQEILGDQLARVGGLRGAPVQATLANPEPWAYCAQVTLFPASGGGLGFWSAARRQIVAVDTCPLLRPALNDLLQDVDLDLPGLRKLTLREGDDGALLAALEVEGVEAPELETDFPVSVAIVLPGGTAANLIGDNYVAHSVKGREFRISAGCPFFASPAAGELAVEAVMGYAGLSGRETALELYSGSGALTAVLAAAAAEVVAVEANPDGVADMAVNLDEFDNVTVYQGAVEEVLPLLEVRPEVVVMSPPEQGVGPEVMRALARLRPERLVYASGDAGSLARDGKALIAAGFAPAEVQPIDMYPQTYPIFSVSWWRPGRGAS